MSDHMLPSTEEVREAYQASGEGLNFTRVHRQRGRDFDAWLEAVKDQARQEGKDGATK
jgi:hypothetical protein